MSPPHQNTDFCPLKLWNTSKSLSWKSPKNNNSWSGSFMPSHSFNLHALSAFSLNCRTLLLTFNFIAFINYSFDTLPISNSLNKLLAFLGYTLSHTLILLCKYRIEQSRKIFILLIVKVILPILKSFFFQAIRPLLNHKCSIRKVGIDSIRPKEIIKRKSWYNHYLCRL